MERPGSRGQIEPLRLGSCGHSVARQQGSAIVALLSHTNPHRRRERNRICNNGAPSCCRIAATTSILRVSKPRHHPQAESNWWLHFEQELELTGYVPRCKANSLQRHQQRRRSHRCRFSGSEAEAGAENWEPGRGDSGASAAQDRGAHAHDATQQWAHQCGRRWQNNGQETEGYVGCAVCRRSISY